MEAYDFFKIQSQVIYIFNVHDSNNLKDISRYIIYRYFYYIQNRIHTFEMHNHSLIIILMCIYF